MLRRASAHPLQRHQPTIELAIVPAILDHPTRMRDRRAITMEQAADRGKAQAETHMRKIDRDLPGERCLRRSARRHQQGALIKFEIACHAKRDESQNAFGRRDACGRQGTRGGGGRSIHQILFLGLFSYILVQVHRPGIAKCKKIASDPPGAISAGAAAVQAPSSWRVASVPPRSSAPPWDIPAGGPICHGIARASCCTVCADAA